MFKYVSDVSELAHYIIKNFVEKKNNAIDATLGNGYDTDFLSENFNKVFSFEIQKESCEKYKEKAKSNVVVINDSHHNFKEYISEDIDCIIYNLGFLPGGDKTITTKYDTTLKSIEVGLELLKKGGIILIAVYRGHTEGKIEEEHIYNFLKNLHKNSYGVMKHEVINRADTSPMLFVIEKK